MNSGVPFLKKLTPSESTFIFHWKLSQIVIPKLSDDEFTFDSRLFGDYESLEAGKARDALVDMMGGVGEGIELKDYHSEDKAKKLFEVLEEAFENHSLMSASIAVRLTSLEEYHTLNWP